MRHTRDLAAVDRLPVNSHSHNLNFGITRMFRPSRILVLCLLGLSLGVYATQRGVTEKGDEVLLEDDGTWRYVKAPPAGTENMQIGLSSIRFSRPAADTFPVRSSRSSAVAYIDPKKWRFTKGQMGADVEYNFQSLEGDLYGYMITERIALPLDTLGEIALNNLRKVAPDAEVQQKEYRYVNDRKMLYMRMNATMRGMKFVYSGYYFSDDNGTTQFLAMTTSNLAQAKVPAIEAFLDGLVFPPATASAEK